jgi:hypothetical protein
MKFVSIKFSKKKTMFLFGCFLSVFAMTGPVLGVVSQEKPQSPPVAGSASQEKPQPSPDDLFVPPDSPIPDIDFSILNQKFRLMDLARDIAESMKNEPTETKFEKIMQMPSGLRRFIMWSLPEEEIIQHFTYTMEKEVAPKYPSKAADVKSLHQKIVEMIPATRQSMQQSRISFEISRKFIMSLTPGEIEIIKGASDLSRMNSEVYINMMKSIDKMAIGERGWNFLEKISSFSPTARELIMMFPPDKRTKPSPTEEVIYDDGFIIIIDDGKGECVTPSRNQH